MARGSNLERVSSFNQVVVLDLIRRAEGGTSRVQLAKATGLSAQTVTNIVRRLLDLGLVSETGKITGGQGKPQTLLNVEARSRYAVGVHLDPSVITFVLLDLLGHVASRSHIEVDAVAGPGETIEEIAVAVDALIHESRVSRELVLGVGVASPGPLDYRKGVVVGPPLLPGWERVELRDSLQVATGLPVILDKETSAAAHAELWGSDDRPSENFAFIYMGTGIGAGVVINGEVVRGASNNVGEIGHQSTGSDGPRCSCGRVGCLGAATKPARLVSEAVESGILTGPFDGSDLRQTARLFRELGRVAEGGDAGAAAIIDNSALRLGRAMEDIANLLDVDHIIFGGPAWSPVSGRYLRVAQAVLADRLAAGMIHKVKLRGTRLGEDVAAIGAGCTVLDHVLSPRTEGLQLTV